MMGIIGFLFALAIVPLYFRLDSVLFLCFSLILDMWENFLCIGPLKVRTCSLLLSSVDLKIFYFALQICFVIEFLHSDVLSGRAISLVLKPKLI